MKLRYPVLAFSLVSHLILPLAHAAPAMYMGKCEIVGEVQSYKKRFSEYEDKSWADSWGLPDGQHYHDLKIRVVESVLAGDETISNHNCDKGKMHIFQLKNPGNIPARGTCIRGVSMTSGDEFRFGDWLYDIKSIADKHCQ